MNYILRPLYKKIMKKKGYRAALRTSAVFFARKSPKIWGTLQATELTNAVEKFADNNRVGSELCNIMLAYGSDKGVSTHNYAAFYQGLWETSRTVVKTVFELGIGTNNPNLISSMGIAGKPGASLRGWQDFFPNAKIYSADIDRDILFSEDRIKCFYCDQTSPQAIKALWANKELSTKKFDILIDDGLHTFDAGKVFMTNSIEKLSPKGFYVVEDVVRNTLDSWRDFLCTELQTFGKFQYAIVDLPHPVNLRDNILIIVRPS